jgi:hypothetical protein
MPLGFFGSQGEPGDTYQISRSLRFNATDSSWMTRTQVTPTSAGTFTFSFWIKRWSVATDQVILYGGPTRGTGQPGSDLYLVADGRMYIDNSTGSGNYTGWHSPFYLRDPLSWYHIVFNQTGSTINVYVNGLLLWNTTTTASNYFNTAGVFHHIGTGAISNPITNFLSSYLAEVHFIDGQVLNASNFGESDPVTGRWNAKAYTGTYGLNGFYLPFSDNSTTTRSNLITYSENFTTFWNKFVCSTVANSTTAPNGTATASKLVINNTVSYGQLYLSLTQASNTIYTFSAYVKALDFTTGALIFQDRTGTYNSVSFNLSTASITGQSGATGTIISVGNGWYRVTCTCNSTTGVATAGNVYIQYEGTGNGVKSSYVWGAQVDVGSTAGPYYATAGGASSAILPIASDMSVAIAGGYNHFIPSNFTLTAGASNDSFVDSPTYYGTDSYSTSVDNARGNYCTLNPLFGTVNTVTDGNLVLTGGSAGFSQRLGTIAVSSGKWYYEVILTSLPASSDPVIGVTEVNNTSAVGQYPGQATSSYAIYTYSTNTFLQKINGATFTNTNATIATAGDRIGVALDLDSGKIWFSKNGTWVDSGNPAAGTNAQFTGLSGTFAPAVRAAGTATTTTTTCNFGQRPFASVPPLGFKALCTTNLPTPRIKKPNNYMDVVTYLGDGTNGRVISGLNFSPDLVWTKSRNGAYDHALSDKVRGIGYALHSNTTAAEDGAYGLSGTTASSYTINAVNQLNQNTNTYVAWLWSKSAIPGLDIVAYTGTGANMTINHSLGVAPKMFINKLRSGVGGWPVYHSSLGNTGAVQLESTGAFNVTSAYWNNTSPTSSNFTVASGLAVNGATYINYLFAEVEGFSKFGLFVGNGSTDGIFVYCGFRPKYILFKNSSAAYHWQIYDAVRNPYNVVNSNLYSSANAVETSDASVDFVSNGFKLRSANYINDNGSNIIYAAFAESPFKYSRAR